MPKSRKVKNPFPPRSPEAFFFDHAGYSHRADETPRAGRIRCARSMADAERRASALGAYFTWELDDTTNRDFTDEGPEYRLWVCSARIDEPAAHASLCGIDLGPDGSAPYEYGCGPLGNPTYKGGRDPYCRVVEAELASELLAEMEIADESLSVFDGPPAGAD